MHFDLDATIERLEPWDFTLTIGGAKRATRRPTVAEVAELTALGGMTNEQGSALLGGLFNPPVEPKEIMLFGQDLIAGFLSAYLTYFRGRSGKNSRAISTAVVGEMAKQLQASGS